MVGPKLDARAYAIFILAAICAALTVTLMAQKGGSDYSSSSAAVAGATSDVAAATRDVAAANREIASAINQLARAVDSLGSKLGSGGGMAALAAGGQSAASGGEVMLGPGGDAGAPPRRSENDGVFELK